MNHVRRYWGGEEVEFECVVDGVRKTTSAGSSHLLRGRVVVAVDVPIHGLVLGEEVEKYVHNKPKLNQGPALRHAVVPGGDVRVSQKQGV